MRKNSMMFGALATAVLVLFISFHALAGAGEEKRVNNATEVLEEIMAIPEKGIPPALLRNFYGIAVLPNMIKAGFVVGGRYGRGILVVHTEKGGWSNPVFVELLGGSVGFQIGGQSTDVILVFKNKRSIDGIMKGKFTLGADASVAAGPVGREVSADTDARFKAEIYSYSRSRGLFAGVSMEGSAIQIDDKSNEGYYGGGITPEDIFAGRGVGAHESAQKFIQTLTKYSSEPKP